MSPSYVIKNWQPPENKSRGFIPGVTAGQRNPWMETHMCGTGPYTLVSYDTATYETTYKAYANYWGSPYNIKPSIQNAIIKTVAEPTTRILDMKAGTADIADIPSTNLFNFVDRNYWFANGIFKSLDPNIQTPGPFTTLNINYVGFNSHIKNPDGSFASFQPFSDKRVRLAFACSVNISQLIQTAINGLGKVEVQVIPPGYIGYQENFKPSYSYNLTRTKELLIAAGKDLGFSPNNPQTVTIIYKAGFAFEEAVTTTMAANINAMHETGLNVIIRPTPYRDLISAVITGQAQAFTLGWAADYADPSDLEIGLGAPSGLIASTVGFNDSRVPPLLYSLTTTVDPNVRAQISGKLLNIFDENMYYLWTMYDIDWGQQQNVLRSWIHGFYNHPMYRGVYFLPLTKG
jgi:peptide/nickel transport system substrate-binding protein